MWTFYDNTQPHKEKSFKQKLKSFEWKELEHRLYSPAVAPSDYYLFRSMAHILTATCMHPVDGV